jgi:carboxy-terminal domain RNA polymerase II polypeptide A small phosphatase
MGIIKNNKILLILDLDETLIHATEKELVHKCDFKVFNYNVYKRPFLNHFLNEIKNDFDLGIWSSASDDYVEEVSKLIFPKNIELQFIWGRSRCTYRSNLQIDELGYYNYDSNGHYHYVKSLKKIKKKGYDLNRVLIVDDSPHKCKDNFGNAIYPIEFKGDMADDELKFLAEYLKILKEKPNVRIIEKRNWRNQVLLDRAQE